jgi:hypothetical protein
MSSEQINKLLLLCTCLPYSLINLIYTYHDYSYTYITFSKYKLYDLVVDNVYFDFTKLFPVYMNSKKANINDVGVYDNFICIATHKTLYWHNNYYKFLDKIQKFIIIHNKLYIFCGTKRLLLFEINNNKIKFVEKFHVISSLIHVTINDKYLIGRHNLLGSGMIIVKYNLIKPRQVEKIFVDQKGGAKFFKLICNDRYLYNIKKNDKSFIFDIFSLYDNAHEIKIIHNMQNVKDIKITSNWVYILKKTEELEIYTLDLKLVNKMYFPFCDKIWTIDEHGSFYIVEDLFLVKKFNLAARVGARAKMASARSPA